MPYPSHGVLGTASVRYFVAGKAFEDPEDCQERGNTRINA